MPGRDRLRGGGSAPTARQQVVAQAAAAGGVGAVGAGPASGRGAGPGGRRARRSRRGRRGAGRASRARRRGPSAARALARLAGGGEQAQQPAQRQVGVGGAAEGVQQLVAEPVAVALGVAAAAARRAAASVKPSRARRPAREATAVAGAGSSRTHRKPAGDPCGGEGRRADRRLQDRQVALALERRSPGGGTPPTPGACCAGRSRRRARRGSRPPARCAPSRAIASARFCGSGSMPRARRSASVSAHTSSSAPGRQLVPLLDALEPGGEEHRERQVGVAGRVQRPELDAGRAAPCGACTSARAPAPSGCCGPSRCRTGASPGAGGADVAPEPLVGVDPLVA